jgi:uncharacterized protein YceH (UPF0502 family)
MDLSAPETRVLGCLLEKQLTTPDMYPLTLNGLRLACNQSTNRDPVVDYDEAVLRDALHRLERRGLARMASGRGSRAPKWRHLLAQALPLSPDEHAILCVLLLRGPQTPGELKQRAGRMHVFVDLDAVHATLDRLAGRELIARLERRPGQKEERYSQLLEDRETSADALAAGGPDPIAASATAPAGGLADADERNSRGPGADGWQAPNGERQPSSAGAAKLTPGAAPSPAAVAAGSSEPLASLAGLQERVARLELEVAELRTALASNAGEAEATAPPAQMSPEAALRDQASREWS